MLEPLVGIILLNWNTAGDTIACYRSLQKLNYQNFKIIVVDNASTDDSVGQMRLQLPEAEIVVNPENSGYAAGNNVGIKRLLDGGCQAVWILNNDTEVGPDSLGEMVKVLSDAEVGIVGGIIYFYRDPQTGEEGFESHAVQFANGGIFWPTGKSINWRTPKDPLKPYETTFIMGASLLVRKEVFDQIGMLPEEYFLNYEETDFCVRARRAGWKLMIVPTAKIWHKFGASMGKFSNRYFFYMHRNSAHFMMKVAPWWAKCLFLPWYVSSMLKGYLVWTFIRRRSQTKQVFLQAMFDGLTGKMGKVDI
jgi:GT2 family glycosyltransferase